MKQKLKNYLKLGILLFGISVIMVNCQKDDDFTIKNESSKEESFIIKKRHFKDLLKENLFSTSLNRIMNSNDSQTTLAYRSDFEELHNFTIDSSVVKEVTKDGYVTYTLLITREEKDSTYFENLVFKVDDSANVSAYIIKYTKNSEPIFVEEHDSYLLDAEMELTEILYENTERVSYECITVNAPMCNYSDENHTNGPHIRTRKCENSAYFYSVSHDFCFWFDDGEGYDDPSGGGGVTGTVGGGGGTTDNPEDPDYDPTNSDIHGDVDTATVLEEETYDLPEEDCEDTSDVVNSNLNPSLASLSQDDLELQIEIPVSAGESSYSYETRIQAVSQYFQNMSATNQDLVALSDAIAETSNFDNLSLDDRVFIWDKTKEIYDILKPHGLEIATAGNLDTLDEILTLSEINTVETNAITIAAFPTLKDLFSEFWPQNEEEWSEFGDFVVTVLQEVVPELIPGVAEVLAIKNAIEDFNSGDYTSGSTELAFAVVGIFPVGKALKAISKIAKGFRTAVRLTKSYRKAKNMVNAISGSLDDALPFWQSLGCQVGNTRSVRTLTNASEKQGRTYFDLLTKNADVSDPIPGPNPGEYRLQASMPDGSTISFRNYSSNNSPTTNATIDFSGGNYQHHDIRELKFDD